MLQVPQDAQNQKRTLISNVKDTHVTASGMNMIESREDDISYLQTDEINGSHNQSNLRTAKELAEYSKNSEAAKGAQMVFNATPDLSN
jgi:hypothetical protein